MRTMRLFLIFGILGLQIGDLSIAGTGTGCSGDQWATGNAVNSAWVYRTNNLWEIGTGEVGIKSQKRGCGIVSARSASKTEIRMENKLCQYHFNVETLTLTVNAIKGKTCPCSGTFKLAKSCTEGEME